MLIALVTGVLVVLMAGQSIYTLVTSGRAWERLLTEEAEFALRVLVGTVGRHMEAYQINDYRVLVAAEMGGHDYVGIVVSDHNMARITGKQDFVTGQVRLADGSVKEYRPDDAAEQAALRAALGKHTMPVVDARGQEIGAITVFTSDRRLLEQQRRILYREIFTLGLFLLMISLAIRFGVDRLVIHPLQRLVGALKETDEHGIPRHVLPGVGLREVEPVVDTLNSMVATIRHGQDDLARQRGRLQSVLEGTRVGTWEWNVQTGELVVNDRWAEIIGYTPTELQPVSIETWTRFAHPDDLQRSGALLEQHFAGTLPHYDCEARMRHKEGHWVWVHDRGRVATWTADGKPLLMAGTHQDISERKRIEEELEKHRHHLEAMVAERTAALETARDLAEAANRAKSVFLSNMSHELRTPLNGIMGMIALAQRRATEPKQIEQLLKATRSADNLLAIISDVLDIARIEADHLVLAQVQFTLGQVLDTLRDAVDTLAEAKGLSLVIECPPDVAGRALYGDPTRIGQILINLVGNAIKFTAQGQVTVRVDSLLPRVEGQVLITLQVIDTGIGIAAADQERIFAPFEQVDGSTTRAYGGTGLGLALCRNLARAMGGDIAVASAPGKGSAFRVSVAVSSTGTPRQMPAEAASDDPVQLVGAEHAGASVLLVEDEPVNREIMFDLLDAAGLIVVRAEDGEQAVEACRYALFDLILMDITMPRMNGIDATYAIRSIPAHARTPIVAVTANAFEEDRDACIRAGMNDHVSKPIRTAAFYATVGHWIAYGRRQHQAQHP